MNAAVRVHRLGGMPWQCPYARGELAVALEAMRAVCGLETVPLALALTEDGFISRVNAARLGCRGPTNILSFPARDGSGEALLLLSLDTLERECLLYGQNPAEHTLRLLAHGMAHVSGLDHGPEMDAVQEAAFTAGLKASGLTERMGESTERGYGNARVTAFYFSEP